jgi:hypothetical protein
MNGAAGRTISTTIPFTQSGDLTRRPGGRAMTAEQEAVERISNYLSEIFVKIMGKAPDPQALRDEAEAFVAKYGPAADPEEMLD